MWTAECMCTLHVIEKEKVAKFGEIKYYKLE